MSTKFFTNEHSNSLIEKFKGVFEHNKDISRFDVLVAYFRSTGYFKLRPYLENVKQIRILVGINVDAVSEEAHTRGIALRLGATAEQVSSDFSDNFKNEIINATYRKDIEESVHTFINDIKSAKVLLKGHPSRRLHAKLYIFRPHNFNQHSGGQVITGSSNLSEAGLGIDHTANYEFNVVLRDFEDVQFAAKEFETLWDEAIAIEPQLVEETKNATHLANNYSSFEIYIKFLIEYFGKEIEFNPHSIGDVPKGWLRLNYQTDAVEQGFNLLERHNGFFLSDVVGLGKTAIAIMIAKKYFFLNNFPEYLSNTLIISPPTIQENWRETIQEFGLQSADIVTNGSIHTISNKERERYDLIIVDEAHLFRNDSSERYQELQLLCKTRCRDGKRRKKVILVSATPLNNRPHDIKNLLMLFQDGNNSTLDINVAHFFSRTKKDYAEITKNKDSRAHWQQEIQHIFGSVRTKILEPLTLRRTRTDLLSAPLYADDLKKQGVLFPKVNPPYNILYVLNNEINELYERTLHIIKNADNSGYHYARYRLIDYLTPEHRSEYLRATEITARLSQIMKTLLVKRIDSSFYAFSNTLHHFSQANQLLLSMIDNNRIIIAPNHDVHKLFEENDEEKIVDYLLAEQAHDPSIKILTKKDILPEFVDLLVHDQEILTQLITAWDGIAQEPDPKLETFLNKLSRTIMSPEKNPSQKLVVFSEAADTTHYLERSLRKHGFRVLEVTGANRARLKDTVRENFDAALKTARQRDDYDILITTEVLAEGVNLHRANSVVNYDTPWNSTRLMQRIGRINRIGGTASDIYIYNFLPTEQVEDEIGLKKRAQIKLQAFHTALGEDSQIYTDTEEIGSFGMFDDLPHQSEEASERLRYLMEIRKFREEHPDDYRRIKDMPLKIRNCVASATENTRHGDTICFLRNNVHNAFYRTRLGGAPPPASVDTPKRATEEAPRAIAPNTTKYDTTIEELDFIECATLLKQHASLPGGALHNHHHLQVGKAIQYFVESARQKILTEEHQPQLSVQEKKVIKYLKALLGVPSLTVRHSELLQRTIESVRAKRYVKLSKELGSYITRLERVPTDPLKSIETLGAILQPYDFTQSLDARQKSTLSAEKPQVVISQSYVAPDVGKGSDAS